MRHIIYALHAPNSEEIRYVGRSSNGMGRPNFHHTHAWKKNEDGSWLSILYVHNWVRTLDPIAGFEVRVLESFEESESVNDLLNESEIRWIAHYRAVGHRLTNATDGGMGILGYRHTEETKALIAEAGRNQVWTEERSQKISEALKGPNNPFFGVGPMNGKNHTEETKAKISEKQTGSVRPGQSGDNHWLRRTGRPSPMKGLTQPQSAKDILSQKLTGKKYPNRKGQRVAEVNSGLEFDQAVLAARHFGISKSTVSRCIQDGLERSGLRFRSV